MPVGIKGNLSSSRKGGGDGVGLEPIQGDLGVKPGLQSNPDPAGAR